MDKKLLWDLFTETGDIEVYLKYKEEEGREIAVETDGNNGSYNQRS